MSSHQYLRILLAPMEGVIDHSMRELLTNIGGIDRCVTEFIRVTDQLLPERVFYRYCPELNQLGKTRAGVPVYLQLLGGKPQPMAENAAKAASLGASGIDLNFGCPAKTVNKNDGGAVLLCEPERLYAIASTVRSAVPVSTPVTAKVRLGFTDCSRFADICDALLAAGVNELTVHARTRSDGYRPPAYWSHIRPIASDTAIPVTANGEIWNIQDASRCREDSACNSLMLGRGLLAKPNLALQIKQQYSGKNVSVLPWADVVPLLHALLAINLRLYPKKYAGNRLKQWLIYLKFNYVEANQLFEDIKRLHCPEEIQRLINMHGVSRTSPINDKRLPTPSN